MNVKLFCHSLVSDWNHGNAHFLRGVVRELRRRGHDVDVLEPADSWSRRNLVRDAGPNAVEEFTKRFPELSSRTYAPAELDLAGELHDADLVLVHDWNEPSLVAAVGAHHRRRRDYTLLFYDAHHRAASSPTQIEAFDLSSYDAVLAFGAPIRDLYVDRGWSRRAYVWHEAADIALFRPMNGAAKAGDLVWIGNWGDGERSAELNEYLLGPARELGLSGSVHGVRYPDEAIEAVRASGLRYRGWLANYRAPETFARHRVTVHVPRRAYVERLPGVPTIRVFEALACGIPLISAPWRDTDGLFRAGEDYLVGRDGAETTEHVKRVLEDPSVSAELAANGVRRIRERHTCGHRVDELLSIVEEVRA
jgi:spore maturation protein CgeB